MKYRTFGRPGWRVGDVGYGMWGLAGWTGRDEGRTRKSLRLAVESGCNFFDTALAYGDGAGDRRAAFAQNQCDTDCSLLRT